MTTDFLVQVERALDTLLDAAIQNDELQQTLSAGTIAAARLRWIDIQVAPENSRDDIVELLHDPIGEALRQSIRRFGQHLFDIEGSTSGMRAVAERLLAESPARHVAVIQLIDMAWHGVGSDADRWAG